MKGVWVQDEQSQTWHVVWEERDFPKKGVAYQSWCGKEFPLEATVRQGALLGFMDIVHDECVRKSEEIE